MTYHNDNARPWQGIWIGGIGGGVIAGMAMGAFAMMYAAFMGMGFWSPLKMIAGTVFGQSAMAGGMGTIFAGMMIHMMTAAAFGVIFAGLFWRSRGARAFLAGVAYSAAVWAVMFYAVLPWANPTMYSGVLMMQGIFFFEHLVYGAVLAITPALVRRYSARPAGVRTIPNAA